MRCLIIKDNDYGWNCREGYIPYVPGQRREGLNLNTIEKEKEKEKEEEGEGGG